MNEKPSATQPIKQIVIHSGDSSVKDTLAGWQTALILADKLAATSINIVHICQADGDFRQLAQHHDQQGDSIIRLPSDIIALLQRHGIAKQQLLADCQAQPNLGNIYQCWSSPQQDFALVDGDYGVDFQHIEFQHYISRLQGTEYQYAIDQFSLAALMAKGHCFVEPSPDKSSILSTFDFSLNVEINSYCQLIANLAKRLGVQALHGKIVEVESTEKQYINGLYCQQAELKSAQKSDDLSKISCDFFIECATLPTVLDNASRTGSTEPITDHQLSIASPIQHTFVVPLANRQDSNTADILKRYPFGFSKQSTLQNSSVLQCYFDKNTSLASVLQALSEAQVVLHPEFDASLINVQDFRPYLKQQGWRANRLLLGNAYAVMDAINDDFIALLHRDIVAWLTVFPAKVAPVSLLNYYNSQRHQLYLSAVDFAQAHYWLSATTDANAWQFAEELLSEQLQHLLELFSQTGVMVEYEQQYVNEKKWIAFLIGFNCVPSHSDPLIEQYSQQQIAQKLTALQQRIKQFAQQLPKYKTTIKMPSVTEHCQISDPAISIGVTDEPISSK